MNFYHSHLLNLHTGHLNHPSYQPQIASDLRFSQQAPSLPKTLQNCIITRSDRKNVSTDINISEQAGMIFPSIPYCGSGNDEVQNLDFKPKISSEFNNLQSNFVSSYSSQLPSELRNCEGKSESNDNANQNCCDVMSESRISKTEFVNVSPNVEQAPSSSSKSYEASNKEITSAPEAFPNSDKSDLESSAVNNKSTIEECGTPVGKKRTRNCRFKEHPKNPDLVLKISSRKHTHRKLRKTRNNQESSDENDKAMENYRRHGDSILEVNKASYFIVYLNFT